LQEAYWLWIVVVRISRIRIDGNQNGILYNRQSSRSGGRRACSSIIAATKQRRLGGRAASERITADPAFTRRILTHIHAELGLQPATRASLSRSNAGSGLEWSDVHTSSRLAVIELSVALFQVLPLPLFRHFCTRCLARLGRIAGTLLPDTTRSIPGAQLAFARLRRLLPS
jgi:hypothetical protein